MLMLLFITIVLMHLAKKHTTLIYLYTIQSAILVFLMVQTSFEHLTLIGLLAILFTASVKLIAAPYFFLRLIRQHKLTFSASAYLNTPLTLLVIALLAGLTRSPIITQLAENYSTDLEPLLLSLASMIVSLFLIINRKGAISQMIGILSMENSIVAFATFAGLEQSEELLLGIMFDLFAWVIIGSIFVAMIYRQFGVIDVSKMKELTE